MITAFRRYLSTWVVRLLFLLLVVSFAVWGVGDVIRMVGRESWVARIGDRTIEAPELQEAYQRQLAQVSRMMRGQMEPTAEMKRSVLDQTLQQQIMQAAIMQEVERLGIVVPDESVREAAYELPAFRGPNGKFDMTTYQTVLRNNGLSEGRFLSMMRADLANRQLVEPVRAGSEPPSMLTRAVFGAENEKRSADLIELPFATAPAPESPSEAQLQRWWENNPDLYSSPEYRRIKAVILSPQTLAKEIEVSESELQTAYEQRKADYVTPEKRSAQVLTAPDEDKAKALAEAWRSGADWERMQQLAKEAGGAAVELNDATQREFPTAELGAAVFAASPDAVVGPVPGAMGWSVLRISRLTPGSDRSLAEVRDELRDRIVAEKAADIIYDRANKVDNLLASGTSLDQLPQDLGLAAVTGTLDAQGNTLSGQPAPIPGPPDLKEAIVQAVFKLAKDEPPRLTEVQTPSSGGSAYYAAVVDDIIPAAPLPFQEVKERVLADWTKDAVRHEQEQAAAKVLEAVKGGQSLEDAATVAGLAVRRTSLTGRAEPTEGFPTTLIGPLFSLRRGEPTMVESPDGFIVAVAAEIQEPDPAADAAGYAQVQEGLAHALGNDTEILFASALRDRARPRINQRMLDSIVQP